MRTVFAISSAIALFAASAFASENADFNPVNFVDEGAAAAAPAALTNEFVTFRWKGEEAVAMESFNVNVENNARIQVTDFKNRGDIFEVFDNGKSLGMTTKVDALKDEEVFAATPEEALNDDRFSKGIFDLAKGEHKITIKAMGPYEAGTAAIRMLDHANVDFHKKGGKGHHDDDDDDKDHDDKDHDDKDHDDKDHDDKDDDDKDDDDKDDDDKKHGHKGGDDDDDEDHHEGKGDWHKDDHEDHEGGKGGWHKGGDDDHEDHEGGKGGWHKGGEDHEEEGGWHKGGEDHEEGGWNKGGKDHEEGGWHKGGEDHEEGGWNKGGEDHEEGGWNKGGEDHEGGHKDGKWEHKRPTDEEYDLSHTITLTKTKWVVQKPTHIPPIGTIGIVPL